MKKTALRLVLALAAVALALPMMAKSSLLAANQSLASSPTLQRRSSFPPKPIYFL